VDPVAVAAGGLSRPEQEAADRLLRDDAGFRAEVERAGRVTSALSALPADAWTASAPPPPPLDLAAALAARPAGTGEPAAAGQDPLLGSRRAAGAGEPALVGEPGLPGPGGPAEADAPARPAADPSAAHPHRGRLRSRRGTPSARRRAPRVVVLRPLSAALASLALLLAGAGGALLVRGASEDAPTRADVPRTAPGAAQPPARVVALEPLRPVATGRERARVALPPRAGGSVRVALDGLEPLRRQEYLELWLLRDGRDMVSLGTFRAGADGRVRVVLPLGVDPGAARFVDVSVERDDGDPTHSGRSVLRSSALS